MLGQGQLLCLGIGVVIGLGLYPAGRSVLRAVWTKAVADISEILHKKAAVPVVPAKEPAPAVVVVTPPAAVEVKP